MKTKTIVRTNFISRIEKILAEVSAINGINEGDVEVIKEILQAELREYHDKVFTYAYDIGRDAGCNEGYQDCYDHGHSEGYASGYDDGYSAA